MVNLNFSFFSPLDIPDCLQGHIYLMSLLNELIEVRELLKIDDLDTLKEISVIIDSNLSKYNLYDSYFGDEFPIIKSVSMFDEDLNKCIDSIKQEVNIKIDKVQILVIIFFIQVENYSYLGVHQDVELPKHNLYEYFTKDIILTFYFKSIHLLYLSIKYLTNAIPNFQKIMDNSEKIVSVSIIGWARMFKEHSKKQKSIAGKKSRARYIPLKDRVLEEYSNKKYKSKRQASKKITSIIIKEFPNVLTNDNAEYTIYKWILQIK